MSEAYAQRGAALGRAAEVQYRRLVAAWAADEVHHTGAYDTERLDRLREIAEEALCSVATRYSARQLLHAVRSLPLPVLMWTVGGVIDGTEAQFFAEVLMSATAAAVRDGRRVRPLKLPSGATAVAVTADEFRELQRTLPEDVARLLAAACLRANAAWSYRMAGKGMRLADLPLPADVISGRVEPDWSFRPDRRIARAVDLYMLRRAAAPGVGGTHAESAGEPTGWMDLAVPNGPLVMDFPALGTSLTTQSFCWRPVPGAGWFGILHAFSPRLSEAFGLDAQALQAICAWLPGAIVRQAALDTLREDDADALTLRFGLLPDDPRADSAIGVLANLNGKGLLRSPQGEWNIPRHKELGDVDHCFTADRVLVVLDMKAGSARSPTTEATTTRSTAARRHSPNCWPRSNDALTLSSRTWRPPTLNSTSPAASCAPPTPNTSHRTTPSCGTEDCPACLPPTRLPYGQPTQPRSETYDGISTYHTATAKEDNSE